MLFRVVSVCFVLFRFVSKQFVSVVSNSIPKQRDSMFRLNRNKQKTNRNSLIESIYWSFSENSGCFGLFRLDSKQFFLFRLFRYRFETPKQTENFSFCFHETNRYTTETDLVSVRTDFFFVSRSPYLCGCPTVINKIIAREWNTREKSPFLPHAISWGRGGVVDSACLAGTTEVELAHGSY